MWSIRRSISAAAASGMASLRSAQTFPLPSGAPEGTLPDGPFVLACPLAGWTSKQWPLEYYEALANMIRTQLHMPMVLNSAPGSLPKVSWR